MHFQLPSNLQQELLAYDPKLKALAKQAENKKPAKKAKYPLGNIPHLIPEDVVRSSYQQTAIDHINTQLVPGRFQLFTKLVDVATPQARTVPVAILYHFEQCWYAAWLPQKGEDYVYGYAYAFKDTTAAAKQVPHQIYKLRENLTPQSIGRGSQVYTYSHRITKQDILDGRDGRNWRVMGIASYYQKARDIHEALVAFEQALIQTIPTWSDTRSIFDRMRCNSIWDALEIPPKLLTPIKDKTTYQLTVDNIIHCAKEWNESHDYISSTYCMIADIAHIISTPQIKKRLQYALDHSTVVYEDEDNESRKNVKYGWKEFEKTIESIYKIHDIWPDCPLDYYQNYYQELRCLHIEHLRLNDSLVQWLRKYMPVASFFQVLKKVHENLVANDRSSLSIYSDYDYTVYSIFELNDTFSMIMRILEHGKELDPPKRWRMPDFHDYVQAEAWKVTNRKEALHQDLFPAPIKVNVSGNDWTFFQPVDTHQLAQWGQAVRNCVGSSSQYAENIKKRKHFIVLCMIDAKPTFTIQLDVSMGVMNVVQIAGVANQRLTDEQREEYSTAFKQALQSREKQLASA